MPNGRITNAEIARMFTTLDKKVDGVNARLDTLNNRSFKNSTDIANMQGKSGAIAFFVSLGVSIIGIIVGVWLKVKQSCG